jgi:4'-phosphopantetheinyl transferase
MSAPSPAGFPTPAGGERRWMPGSLEPRLAGSEAHVWRVNLTVVADDIARSLSGDETARAARIVGQRQRQRRLWARSRGVLRALLGRYLREDATAIELAVGAHGKPELTSAADSPRKLFFNLSHSQHLALYAFTAVGAIGVDVQVADDANTGRATDHVALARRTFGDVQARRLDALEPTAREREFLRLWTRHEAELKRRGTGIGVATAGAQVAADARAAPWIVELDVGTGAAAAVAVAPAMSDLRLWDWR